MGNARWALLVVLLLLGPGLASTAAAREFVPYLPGWLKPDRDNPVGGVPYAVPCLSVDVDLGWRDVNATFDPPFCNWPKVNLTWNATPQGGRGEVRFAFDSEALEPREPPSVSPPSLSLHSSDSEPVPLSPLTWLATLLEGGGESEPLPRTGVVVVARFDVAWGGDCADARGSFSASVNGEKLDADAPSDLFRHLCDLSMGRPEEPARAFAGLALSVAQALAPSAPVPGFDALVEGLAHLLSTLDEPSAEPAPDAKAAPGLLEPPAPLPSPEASRAPETPSLPAFPVPRAPPAPSMPSVPEASERPRAGEPAMPSHEERGAGNVTLEALTPGRAAGATYDALLVTPAAERTTSGRVFVDLPPWLARGRTATERFGGAPAPLTWDSSASTWRATSPSTLAPAQTLDATPVPEEGGSSPQEAAPREGSGLGPEDLVAAGLAVGFAAALLAAAVALHHRVTRGDALRHPARAALHRACVGLGRPATVSELAGLAGLPRKTAEYHLHHLARLGLLRREDASGGPRRFAPATLPRREAAEPLEDALVARLRDRPGSSAGELAAALGVSRLRVDRRVKDLLVEGRLDSRVEDGRRRLYLA